jgi:hypothetical protein
MRACADCGVFCEKAAADSNAKNEAFANVAEKKLAFLGRFGYGEFCPLCLGWNSPGRVH